MKLSLPWWKPKLRLTIVDTPPRPAPIEYPEPEPYRLDPRPIAYAFQIIHALEAPLDKLKEYRMILRLQHPTRGSIQVDLGHPAQICRESTPDHGKVEFHAAPYAVREEIIATHVMLVSDEGTALREKPLTGRFQKAKAGDVFEIRYTVNTAEDPRPTARDYA